MEYKLISKYRTELMGIAMLWVVVYHSTIDIMFLYPLYLIKRMGYGGVDIFLLVSGIGMYYSFKKDDNIIKFYKRRFIRIIPTYLPIVLAFSLIFLWKGMIKLKNLFLNITTLGFWLNSQNAFDWYVPSLIFLYLLTPIYMKKFNRNQNLTTYITVIVSIVISMLISITKLNYLLILTIRIPIFCIGVLVGYYIDKKKEIEHRVKIIYISMFFAGLGMLNVFFLFYSDLLRPLGLYWYPYILITLPLCIFLAKNFEVLGNSKCQYNILNFFGSYSLEIYIYHERILKLSESKAAYINFDGHNILFNIICLGFTCLMAYLWKKIINSFLGRKLFV